MPAGVAGIRRVYKWAAVYKKPEFLEFWIAHNWEVKLLFGACHCFSIQGWDNDLQEKQHLRWSGWEDTGEGEDERESSLHLVSTDN